MKAMFLRELRALWQGMTGWIIAALIPLAFATMTALHMRSGSVAEYIRVIMDSTLVFMPIVVLYAAQGYSKDARDGADRLLHSLPVNAWQVTLGRYFAWCVPLLAGTAISLLYPLVLSFFADIAVPQLVGGMLAFALYGMVMTALALYLSRVHRNAFVNVLVAIVALAICYFLPNIAAFLIQMGFAALSALVCFAILGIWFGWKATRSFPAALATGLVLEAAGLWLIGNRAEAGAAFWNRLCGVVNIQTMFASTYIGILDVSNLIVLLLVLALFVSLSAFGWQMEALCKGRVKQ